MAAVADVDADFAEVGVENGVAGVALKVVVGLAEETDTTGSEQSPTSTTTWRNHQPGDVVLAVLADVVTLVANDDYIKLI